MSHDLKVKGLFMMCLLLLSGCSLLPKEEEVLTPPLVKPVQENYRTAAAVKGTITKEVKGSGRFESTLQDRAIYKEKEGRISKIHVKSGDKVNKGDVLVELLLDGLDIQLQEQEIALENAKNTLREAKINENADPDAYRMASMQYELEQTKYKRLQALYESKIIRAEIGGQVIFVDSLKEGDAIEQYQTLVSVADPANLRVIFEVNSTDETVDVGSDVQITFKNTVYKGVVVQSPSSAPITQNEQLAERYRKNVYISLAELPEEAEIGSLVDVKIITEQRDNVIKIPRGGLRSYLGRNFVRVLEDGSKLREIDVEPGITSSTEVEIVKGLEEGQTIILQ
ncbi:hypothetical protein YSY43_46370 [Paenibacillus sp. YSY-4.3]